LFYICLFIACVQHNQSYWSTSADTVAGSSSGIFGSSLSELNEPIAMYYDKPNKVIIVGDSNNHRVLKFSLDNPSSDGTVIAGGNGPGCKSNQFYNTVGVALDSSRQLYVTDSACGRLLKFSPNSNSTTFGVVISYLNLPQGIFIDPLTDDLYVAIYSDSSIAKFTNGSNTSVVVAGA
jgi:DNA-binding beta-propeller fold protein YncE